MSKARENIYAENGLLSLCERYGWSQKIDV
jgi:hypothetical protein